MPAMTTPEGDQIEVGISPTSTTEPEEILVWFRTRNGYSKVCTIAPSYGLRRYRGITDPLIRVDELGRVEIRR